MWTMAASGWSIPSSPSACGKFSKALATCCVNTRPREAAIEEVFMGRNAASALKLGQSRGSAIVACLANGVPVAEYAPRKVKQALVGNGAAGKQQVQHMVKLLLRIEAGIAEDAADALAVAVCHAHSSQGLARIAAGGYSRGRLRR